ncbi:MAG: hypothetical protein CMB77_03740 [Euryarchaeota archaeon]|nr:hypothetical protein [Euryarchaeota archaeon]|tara:strand:- start:1596 stop:1790 length:195 start_codon:yes stop_codon:yes gene_type:complete
MAACVAIFVFIYGIMEKDFWWALWACAASFFVALLIEIIYATMAFTAMFSAIEAFSNLVSQMLS